ncbi:unnamed protein product [marine sediment metagenome]|uniref:Uncharacterized protein n=1 Tax=marine sediment metagenome TaxID=412755 RepID=X1MUW6_9ZZZZ
MGLKKIVGIRQYTTFTPAGKVQKMYEVTFTTEKTEGEFTFDIPVDKYEAKLAMGMAQEKADEIDKAMG